MFKMSKIDEIYVTYHTKDRTLLDGPLLEGEKIIKEYSVVARSGKLYAYSEIMFDENKAEALKRKTVEKVEKHLKDMKQGMIDKYFSFERMLEAW